MKLDKSLEHPIGCGSSLITSAITAIQQQLARNYGARVNTETGAATLSVSHDQISLTDRRNSVAAFGVEAVVVALAGAHDRDDNERLTITLDPLATKLARWVAELTQRDVEDVVNGVVAGQLGHIRSEVESEFHDDSLDHLNESIGEAITRRQIRDGKRRYGRIAS